jgi:hypothetical protein
MDLFPNMLGSEGRGSMDTFSCEECRAIYRGLQDASAAARNGLANWESSPQQLAVWLEHLNEDDCARMRATSSLWKTWRRLMEYRTLSGHSLSLLLLPPNAINPN